MSKIIYDVIQRFEVENGVPRLVSTNIQVIEGGEDLLSLAINMLDKLGFYDKFEEKRTSQYIGYRLKNPGKGAKRYQLVLAQRKEGLCISIPQDTLEPYLLKLNFLINFSTQLSKFKNLVKVDHTISRAYWIIPSKKNVFMELSKEHREILGNQLVGDFEFICNSIVSFEYETSDLDIYKSDINHNNSPETLIKYHQEYVTNHTLLKSLDNSDCCLKIGRDDIGKDKLFNYAYQVSISSSEVVKNFLVTLENINGATIMFIKPKRLVNPYEERMLEFLQTCVEGNYKIHPQVSLCQFCELNSNFELELRKFFFSSSVDALITDTDYKPCLVVDFQSQYHDSIEAKERDRKKATLLNFANIPLLYSRLKEFGLLHLYSKDEEVVFNLFTGEQRENAKALIRKYCEQSACSEVKVLAC